tara:strand:- start:62 stop:289 length:228 start_codon:yes stop_codon:yes gene_type:complete
MNTQKHTNKRKPSRLDTLQFRIEQLEIALMNLMFIVANQEEELPEFRKNLKRAESTTNKYSEILSMVVNDEGAEA